MINILKNSWTKRFAFRGLLCWWKIILYVDLVFLLLDEKTRKSSSSLIISFACLIRGENWAQLPNGQKGFVSRPCHTSKYWEIKLLSQHNPCGISGGSWTLMEVYFPLPNIIPTMIRTPVSLSLGCEIGRVSSIWIKTWVFSWNVTSHVEFRLNQMLNINYTGYVVSSTKGWLHKRK
jgi:hypothetical protein